MKCEHERAVHLFVDSLMNKDHMSFAFQCTGPDRFKKGICLSCRKNRCNNIGYNARKMRKRRNSKMYLKTRADTPFGGELYTTWTCIVVSVISYYGLHSRKLISSSQFSFLSLTFIFYMFYENTCHCKLLLYSTSQWITH